LRARGVAPAFIDQLLAAFGELRTAAPQDPQFSIFNSQFEPLTDREIEVLRLLGAGLSDREIAERMIIALGTVKRHLSNLYDKLGVHSRTQALARAAELGLL
jgi:LuxR family transcriptional regulator, maltose regulon positive regulatory protein